MEPRNRARRALTPELRHDRVIGLIELAIQEDLTDEGPIPVDLIAGDVTSRATMVSEQDLQAVIFTKQSGVLAGLSVAAAVFQFVHPSLKVHTPFSDGTAVDRGVTVMEVSGPGRLMLLAERTALNFLGRMAGIATATRRYVEAVAATRAVVLDTRKTLPGFRILDKYAVRMGGGGNHRMGLYDMALIKDNHIEAAGGVEPAVRNVRTAYGPEMPIEVEVKDLEELKVALRLPVNRILLDNMDLDTMRAAVRLSQGKVALEASGNVNLSTIRAIAETGVDFISSGALTHSVSVFDFSMRVLETGG